MSDVILSLFNEKLALAARLAVRYGPYQNDEEQYRFIYASYCCASFTVTTFDEKADYWESDIFDCDDFEDITDPQSEVEAQAWDPSSKGEGADYLAIVKVVLTGDNEEDGAKKVDKLTAMLNRNETNTTMGADRRRLIEFADEFMNYTEICMKGDVEGYDDDFYNCSTYLGLNLPDFAS